MKTVILTLFTLYFFQCFGQSETDRRYVRIIVSDANSLVAAQEIDQFIRSQAGVYTSRMDRRTAIYFGIYDASAGLNSSSFSQWIDDLGYTPKCIVEGPHGDGTPMIPLTRELCVNQPSNFNLED